MTSIYQAILNRTPETAGLDGFLAELSNGASQSDVITQIYNSPEAVADRAAQGVAANPKAPGQIALVTSLYQTILNRTPETAGLKGFLAATEQRDERRERGRPDRQLPRGRRRSAASTPPTTPTNAAEVSLVTSLYQTILEPDPGNCGSRRLPRGTE